MFRVFGKTSPFHHTAEEIDMASIGSELPKEMARVRDKVLPIYLQTPMGHIAAAMMRH